MVGLGYISNTERYQNHGLHSSKQDRVIVHECPRATEKSWKQRMPSRSSSIEDNSFRQEVCYSNYSIWVVESEPKRVIFLIHAEGDQEQRLRNKFASHRTGRGASFPFSETIAGSKSLVDSHMDYVMLEA